MLHELLFALSGVSGGIFVDNNDSSFQVCRCVVLIANMLYLFFSKCFRVLMNELFVHNTFQIFCY